MVNNNPLDMENIKEQQDADNALLQHATKYADQYTRNRIGTIDDIICYIKPRSSKQLGYCITKKPAATNN